MGRETGRSGDSGTRGRGEAWTKGSETRAPKRLDSGTWDVESRT